MRISTVALAFVALACASSPPPPAERPEPPPASASPTPPPAPEPPTPPTPPTAPVPPTPPVSPAPAAKPAPAKSAEAKSEAKSGYSGPGACTHATKGKSPVAKACAQGGIKQAKVVMKDLVKKAKAAGVKFTCDDCHADDADYAKMTDDAHDKFEKLIAAVK